MSDPLRQTGRSHKQIIEALTRLETERRVVYLVTDAPEYYLAIACQLLMWSKTKYKVSKTHNISIITEDGHVLWFKRYNAELKDWLRGIPESQLFRDHHLAETEGSYNLEVSSGDDIAP